MVSSGFYLHGDGTYRNDDGTPFVPGPGEASMSDISPIIDGAVLAMLCLYLFNEGAKSYRRRKASPIKPGRRVLIKATGEVCLVAGSSHGCVIVVTRNAAGRRDTRWYNRHEVVLISRFNWKRTGKPVAPP